MPTYPKSGSILDSTTRTGLSVQIIILVNNEPVGAITSFSEDQSRSIQRLTEIGLDGTLEGVPSSPTEISLQASRTYFDGLSLPEAFSRGFRNIGSQRIPFDIVVIDQNSGTGENAVITTYRNCWFESISRSWSSDDYVIVEDASIFVEAIETVRNGEAVALSQGVGGGRQIAGIQIDSTELEADSGVRRGALDFPGLITAAFE